MIKKILITIFHSIVSIVRIVRIVRWDILSCIQKSIVVKTKQGIFCLPLGVKDIISWELYIAKGFSFDLMKDMMELIRDLYTLPKGKGTILDIGANNGVMSIGMIYNGLLDKAIAVEPDPTNFSTLKHNVQLNDFENKITCLNYAVSDSKAMLQFELSETNYGDHRVRKINKQPAMFSESKRQVIEVLGVPLEDLFVDLEPHIYENISVIWIDIQGYEGYVFRGGKKFLSLSGLPVVSEIWPYGIARTGMTKAEFCGIVEAIWSHYWIKRYEKFVKYPIDMFHIYFEELNSSPESYADVLFTNGK